MGFSGTVLSEPKPDRISSVSLPRRSTYFASPAEWRDEVIYFLLPDRFSDGREKPENVLDVNNVVARRPADFAWNKWSDSGANRYQGGTLKGIESKLDYIASLGVSTLWVGPVFKNRSGRNDYHGYAIQDYLDVDPRLGTRDDLVELVSAAHTKNMRVLLDIAVNHTGNNWNYEGQGEGDPDPTYRGWPEYYDRGKWRDREERLADTINGPEDGVWPEELQPETCYTRAGQGDLGKGEISDPHAEFRRTDFYGDRDINYDQAGVLDNVARCFKYWIALTDCDGLRLDALKHFAEEAGRNFCGTIKEFAAGLGKVNFFLVAEVAGADSNADRYLEVLGSNLDATLDIGDSRPTLTMVAKGLQPPADYFRILRAWDDDLGSHRNSGKRRVSVLDDHDHVNGQKVRFSSDASNPHQVVAGVALQLFSLGIPCIYYGTEQAFAGPEKSERKYLPDYGSQDRYLRESMFGPEHPHKAGLQGIGDDPSVLDQALPGFGPFGTVGAHCFNDKAPAYIRIKSLIDVRRNFPALRYGRLYQREVSNGDAFRLPDSGQLIAWSRILDDEEVLCIINGHGTEARDGNVLIDASLNSPKAPGDPWNGKSPYLRVIANTKQAATNGHYTGSHAIGSELPMQWQGDIAYVSIQGVEASEVLALTNRP